MGNEHYQTNTQTTTHIQIQYVQYIYQATKYGKLKITITVSKVIHSPIV